MNRMERLRAEALRQSEAAQEAGERVGLPFFAYVGPSPMVPLWVCAPVSFVALYLLEIRGAPEILGLLATVVPLVGSIFVGIWLIQEARWVVHTNRRVIWLAASKRSLQPGGVVASEPVSDLTVVGGRLSWGWSHIRVQREDGTRLRINVTRPFREGLKGLWQALAG